MNRSLPFSELDVIGFVGCLPPEDWPARPLPVYRSRVQLLGLWPPFQEQGELLQGEPLGAMQLEDMLAEGEFTPLPTPQQARPGHLLWLSASGPRYEPRSEAERALEDICRQATRRALQLGLQRGSAREQLFRALRARPTTVANALLAVHFQLANDFAQVYPLREDLAALGRTPASELERELVQTVTADRLAPEVVSAVATELRRAQRHELASILEEKAHLPESARHAARPAPLIGWSTIVELPA